MRPKYFFCFICVTTSRLISVLFSVYMQLWIMSFHKNGVLETTEEADAIYMRIVIGSLISVSFVAPLFGKVCDKLDPRMIVPATFAARGFIAASFKYLNDPRGWHANIFCILMITMSMISFISVEVLFMRNMKPHIRGTLSGIAFFFGSIGTTFFALAGGIMFDSIGPWAPFLFVASADCFVFIISLIFIMFGLIDKQD